MSNTITVPEKFTKEIKENWLTALKSGKFTQGFGQLEYNYKDSFNYCCIGVLGCITEGLSNDSDYLQNSNPWQFLELTVGLPTTDTLWKTNDGHINPELKELGNYLNVIPLIEALPTQD